MNNSSEIEWSEISALIRLAEDPDPMVFKQVKTKLMDYGRHAKLSIETEWTKVVESELHQNRLLSILREIQLDELKLKLLKWKDSANRDLLSGVTIISQFQFPDINEFEIEAEIEKIKQQVWLEINDGQTAFETVKIMNHVMV